MNYRRKPLLVSATRWFPGVEIANLRRVFCALQYDVSGRFYYCSMPGQRSTGWLSVDRFPGPAPTEPRAFDGYVQIQDIDRPAHDIGRPHVWHRRVLPFAFYEPRSGVRDESPDLLSDLWLDYAGYYDFPAAPPVIAFLGGEIVHEGDWVVDDNHHVRILSPANFEADYELAS